MKSSIGILLGAWVFGVSMGVWGAVFSLIGTGILLFICIAYYSQKSTQFFVALTAIILLGVQLGAYAQSQFRQCQGEVSSRAVLNRTYAISFEKTRYVFKRNDGCTILVSAPRYPLLVRGSEVNIIGSQSLASPRLQENGVDLTVVSTAVHVEQKGTFILDRIRISIINQALALFSYPDSALAIAMLVGDTGMLSSSIQDAFRESGITHILSISGLHVTVLIGMCVYVLRIIPMPEYIRIISLMLILWGYIYAIGAVPSAIRAGLFWTLFSLAYMTRRLIGLLTVIIGTVTILITIQPLLVRAIGFQLSVMAVVGIWFAIRIIPQRNAVASLAVVSLGATLGTLPLIVFYFGGFSLISVIVNIVVVPVIPVVLISMLFALCVSYISLPFAMLISYIPHIGIVWILFVTQVAQHIPYAYIDELAIPIWSVAIYYVALISACLCVMQWRGKSLNSLWI